MLTKFRITFWYLYIYVVIIVILNIIPFIRFKLIPKLKFLIRKLFFFYNYLRRIIKLRSRIRSLTSITRNSYIYKQLRLYLKIRTRLRKYKSVLIKKFSNQNSEIDIKSITVNYLKSGESESSYSKKFLILGIGSLGAGGAERQWANLAIALKHRGENPLIVIMQNTQLASEWILRDLYDNEIEILSLSDLRDRHNYLSLDFPAEIVGTYIRKHSRYTELLHPLQNNLTFLYTVFALKKIKYDLVISALDISNIYFGFANLLSQQSRHIASFRSLSPELYKGTSILYRNENILKDLYLQLIQSGTVYLSANSTHALDSYLEYFGFKREAELSKKATIPNITFLSETALKVIDKKAKSCCSKFHFLGFMRLSFEKNPLCWLDSALWAYQNIESQFHFILGGTGPLLEEVLEKIQALAKLGVVIDFYQNPYPIEFFKLKGALIVSSLSEGHSNLIEEAKYFSLPVFTLFQLFDKEFSQTQKPYSDLKKFILLVDTNYVHGSNELNKRGEELFTKYAGSYLGILD